MTTPVILKFSPAFAHGFIIAVVKFDSLASAALEAANTTANAAQGEAPHPRFEAIEIACTPDEQANPRQIFNRSAPL